MSEAYEKARAKIVDDQHGLYDTLYALVKDAIGAPPLEESIKWSQLMFHRGTENLIALIPVKGRVNLQFFNGAHLDQSSGLVDGTGKDLRHVKCHDVGFLEKNRAVLMALVAESVERGADVR